MPPRRKPLRASTSKLDKAGKPKPRRMSKAERQFRHDVLARDVYCVVGMQRWDGEQRWGLCSNAGMAVHAHHVGGRVGALMHDPSNGIGVCFAHHSAIHAHPAWSYEAGYMKHRNYVGGDAV